MLELNDLRWKELEHAYGSAEDIPDVLTSLMQDKNVWDELWSSLCHQGTIYTATFAAFPYMVSYFKNGLDNNKVDLDVYIFATCIEISRQIDLIEIPEDLKDDYFTALKMLKQYQNKADDLLTTHESLVISLAYQAILKNQVTLAELLLNMDEKSIEQTSEWFFTREI